MQQFLRDFGWEGRSFIISALTGEGCKALTYAIMEYLEQNRAPAESPEDNAAEQTDPTVE